MSPETTSPAAATTRSGRVPPVAERLNTSADPTLATLHAEIARAFHYFNERFWNGRLPVVVFSFFPQPPNGSRLGHFWAKTWKDGDGDRRHEIILYADLCLAAGIEQVMQTLLHEMVHLWQHEHGLPGKNNHHNREWHTEAARVGLVTEGRKGYTSGGEGFKAALADLAPSADAVPFRAPPARAKGKMALWVCKCPRPFKIRLGRSDLDALCKRCGADFIRVEEK